MLSYLVKEGLPYDEKMSSNYSNIHQPQTAFTLSLSKEDINVLYY